MAKKSTKSAVPNWKKKKWFEIVAPQIYSDKVIGETLAESPESVMGRTVKSNLMTLIGNPRKQNFSVKLRVEKISGNKGITKPIQLTMINSSVRRLIRAGKERIDLSFVATSKDKVKLRIKPLLITKTKTTNSKLVDVQLKTKEFLTEFISKNNYEGVFDAVTRSTLQKELKGVLDKVFPLKMVEIRVLEVELESGNRKLSEIVVEQKTEDKKEE